MPIYLRFHLKLGSWLPSFGYTTYSERNEMMRIDIIKVDIEQSWINPIVQLGTKMANYTSLVLHMSNADIRHISFTQQGKSGHHLNN